MHLNKLFMFSFISHEWTDKTERFTKMYWWLNIMMCYFEEEEHWLHNIQFVQLMNVNYILLLSIDGVSGPKRPEE